MRKIWSDDAWEDYIYWQTQDRKTLKKVNALIKDIDRNGYRCTGKPEPLTGNLAGFWSLRIDEKNRLVFRWSSGYIMVRWKSPSVGRITATSKKGEEGSQTYFPFSASFGILSVYLRARRARPAANVKK